MCHWWGSRRITLAVAALITAGLAAFMMLGDRVTGNRTLLYLLAGIPVCGVPMPGRAPLPRRPVAREAGP